MSEPVIGIIVGTIVGLALLAAVGQLRRRDKRALEKLRRRKP